MGPAISTAALHQSVMHPHACRQAGGGEGALMKLQAGEVNLASFDTPASQAAQDDENQS